MSLRNCIFIIVTFLLFSCNNTSKEDVVFKERFFNNIAIIKDVANYYDSITILIYTGKPYEIEDLYAEKQGYNEAICFNVSVSGIDRGQPEYNDIDSIIKLWEGWYEQNKYTMTMPKADSIYFYDCEAFNEALDLSVARGDLSEEYFSYLLDSIRTVGKY